MKHYLPELPESEECMYGENTWYLLKLKGYAGYQIAMYVDEKWKPTFTKTIDAEVEWWVNIDQEIDLA